jgi:hypothetical protein
MTRTRAIVRQQLRSGNKESSKDYFKEIKPTLVLVPRLEGAEGIQGRLRAAGVRPKVSLGIGPGAGQ